MGTAEAVFILLERNNIYICIHFKEPACYIGCPLSKGITVILLRISVIFKIWQLFWPASKVLGYSYGEGWDKERRWKKLSRIHYIPPLEFDIETIWSQRHTVFRVYWFWLLSYSAVLLQFVLSCTCMEWAASSKWGSLICIVLFEKCEGEQVVWSTWIYWTGIVQPAVSQSLVLSRLCAPSDLSHGLREIATIDSCLCFFNFVFDSLLILYLLYVALQPKSGLGLLFEVSSYYYYNTL
jgi:hypothetical protein